MTDETKEKKERSEKNQIIEVEIELPYEALGGELSHHSRKTRLQNLTLQELKQVAYEIRNIKTREDANRMIEKAIHESNVARRKKEYQEDGFDVGPANVSMYLCD